MISFQIDENIKLVKCSTALSPSGLDDIDYALNPYIGCGHGCLYCYGPDIIRSSSPLEWGTWIHAKTNISRQLRKEIADISNVTIGLSTVTDPYQPIEEELALTRSCLEILRARNLPLIIMTKSPLILRDIDILQEMRDVEVSITITTLDSDVCRIFEPNAPSISDRLRALEELTDIGISTSVLISPILISSNDWKSGLFKLIERIAETGCQRLSFDGMRLRPTAQKRIECARSDRLLAREAERLISIVHDSSRKRICPLLSDIPFRELYPELSIEVQDPHLERIHFPHYH